MEHNDDPTTAFGKKTRNVRSIVGPILLGMALVMVAILALPASQLNAQGPDSGHVIVQFDENDLAGRRIDFTAPISGLKALELTGLEVITQDLGWGIGVCSIGGVGCPASNCFCDPNNFWNYSYWDGNAWQGYLVGADSSVINDGAVEGWRWGPWGSSMPPAPPIIAATDGLEWLRPLQSLNDGGYGGGGATAETLMAVAADGYQATEWRRGADSPSLMTYFLANGATLANSGASPAGKMAVALAAGGGCWSRDAMKPMDYYQPGTGAYSSTNPFDTGTGPHTWGMLGTAALSQTIPPSATQYLKNLQQPDGGWEWDIGWGSDTNSTALAIQALVAAGEPAASPAIVDGLNYLEGAQNDDGGFPYSPISPWGTDSDTNSTAYVVQALLAAGDPPTGTRWLTYTLGITPTNPITFLLSMQLADGGFEWQKGIAGDRQSSTRQAIPALLGRPFPLEVAEVGDCPVFYFPVIHKQ